MNKKPTIVTNNPIVQSIINRPWMQVLFKCCAALWSSFRDLLPIIVTVALFQIFVFQKDLGHLGSLLLGLMLVVAGLTLFIAGLQLGLFPLGEQLAYEFARKGSLLWLLLFAFGLGFGTTFAEPALIAISQKAGDLASRERFPVPPLETALVEPSESPPDLVEPAASNAEQVRLATAFSNRYAFVLRFVVAISVGSALVLGVIRILRGWPVHYLILAGYTLVIVLTPFAPAGVIGVAYDAGGVTTSTITVPLTAALGVGLANCIQGRSPLLDGFGLIAFASLTPIVFVLLLGIVWQ